MSSQELQFIITEDLFLFKEDLKTDVSQPEKPVDTEPQSNLVQEPKPELKVSPVPDHEEKPAPIQVRGAFEKGILVLHEEAELPEPVMEMLVKMIGAVGHSMKSVGMLSSEQVEGRSLEELYELNPHIILKFGRIKHPVNAIPTTEYHIHNEAGVEYLFADALSSIAEDKILKGKLWNTLKILFNISK
ncbi:hypothetical protein [Algoriphagus halophytocola]|uniref:Uncharacterized protein n=1 Tax=Algoriphagus halophytocola TaxID=2991499 RepID=A0ABY6MIK3_9BACT|nr:hypothetical protein [Algoriphagus sp. TR-M5]UZD23612.1 hypothetical protein OM944_03775 [Algoriphagus sp. TR-M5]